MPIYSINIDAKSLNSGGSIKSINFQPLITLKSKSDGNCRNIDSQSIKFGENMDTSCIINLSRRDFTNCDKIENELWKIWQPNLQMTNVVRKFSNNGSEVLLNDLVEIIRWKNDEDDYEPISPTRLTTCENLPALFTMSIFYVSNPAQFGTVYEIIGVMRK